MSKLMSFTGIALKNLISKPVTTQYPDVPKEYPERTRGHVENQIDQCILCGMCMRKCPPGAIKVDRAKGTWTIERFDCIQCGYCTEVCPKKCLKMVPGYQEPESTKQEETIKKPDLPTPAVPKKSPAAAAMEHNSKMSEQTGENRVENTETTNQNQIASEHAAITEEKNLPCSDLGQCVFCTLCAKKCPAQAITVDRDQKTWNVDEDSCLGCGVCADSCPKHCIKI